MKKLLAASLLLLLAACATSPPPADAPAPAPAPMAATAETASAPAIPAAQPPAVPYSVSLTGFTISGFPGVHSAIIVGSPDQLVVIGGRQNGLHTFPSGNTAASQPAFPRSQANTTIYVLNLTTQTLLGSASVTTLPAPIASQLQSTNMQGELVNGWIYLIGGYGPDPQGGSLTTLPVATAVNYQALVNAIVNNVALDATFAAANIVQFTHPALAITGGELGLLPDATGPTDFVLTFGQTYVGEYTPGGGLASQVYADGVRIFQFTYPTGSNQPSGINFVAAVPDPTQVQQSPESPYHRRDFTLQTSLDASGNPRLIAYGGVFKGGRMEGFLDPVFITPGSNSVTLTDNTSNQWMNQYSTASIQLFDQSAATMYTTFLGGISQYYWNGTAMQRDAVDIASGIDGLPFVNSVTTMVMPTATDAGLQYLHVGETFPPASAIPSCGGTSAPYGGAEAKFVLASGVSTVGSSILNLDGITSPGVVGYVVGGIAATAPYASTKGTSCASGTIYSVTLNPTQPTNTVLLSP